jgi:hypothetical protein
VSRGFDRRPVEAPAWFWEDTPAYANQARGLRIGARSPDRSHPQAHSAKMKMINSLAASQRKVDAQPQPFIKSMHRASNGHSKLPFRVHYLLLAL